jgi:hypothetical protein
MTKIVNILFTLWGGFGLLFTIIIVFNIGGSIVEASEGLLFVSASGSAAWCSSDSRQSCCRIIKGNENRPATSGYRNRKGTR